MGIENYFIISIDLIIIRVIVIGVLDCFIFIVLYDLDLILFGFYFLGDF